MISHIIPLGQTGYSASDRYELYFRKRIAVAGMAGVQL